jgi:Na+/phosphate symporter
MKHLGIQLGKTIGSTIQETLANIEPKLVKRRILAITLPTDLLHRATLIITAFLPVYSHVFMTLHVEPNHTEGV